MQSKSRTKFNTSHEAYRVCPECKTEFYASHLSRKFCNKKCHDTFHNRVKLLKNEEEILNEGIRLGLYKPSQSTNDVLAKNIFILYSITGAKNLVDVEVATLYRFGFNFSGYEARYPYDNSGKYWLQYGNYHLCLIYENVFRILKTN